MKPAVSQLMRIIITQTPKITEVTMTMMSPMITMFMTTIDDDVDHDVDIILTVVSHHGGK